MSEENLELLRSIYSRWERGDYTETSWADPQIEFGFADGPAPTIAIGVDAMATTWRDALSVWSGLCAEAEKFIELDEVRVLVFTRNTGQGRGSGVELAEMLTRSANLFHFRGGKVTRLIIYFDRDRALADVGLPGEAELR